MAFLTRVPKEGKDAHGRVRWRVRWTEDGRERCRTFDTASDAREWRADVEAAAGSAALGAAIEGASAPAAFRSFREVAEEYLDTLDVRPRNLADYRRHLRMHVYPIFGEVAIDAVTVAQVQAYVAAMRDLGRSPKTILNVHGTVVVPVFDFAYERSWRGPHRFRARSRRRGTYSDSGGVIRMPQSRGRTVTRDTVLLPEEAADFLSAAYAVDQMTGDIVATLYLTGLRWGELVPLRVSDLDLEADPPILTVRQVARRNEDDGVEVEDDEGKSVNAFRDVLLSDGAVGLLRRRAAGRAPDDLLFTAPWGGQLSYGVWHERRWGKVTANAAAAGYVKKLTPHKLRHGYATAMIDGGAGMDFISSQLGHSSVAFTQATYVHLTKKRAEANRSLIDVALGGMLTTPRLASGGRRRAS